MPLGDGTTVRAWDPAVDDATSLVFPEALRFDDVFDVLNDVQSGDKLALVAESRDEVVGVVAGAPEHNQVLRDITKSCETQPTYEGHNQVCGTQPSLRDTTKFSGHNLEFRDTSKYSGTKPSLARHNQVMGDITILFSPDQGHNHRFP